MENSWHCPRHASGKMRKKRKEKNNVPDADSPRPLDTYCKGAWYCFLRQKYRGKCEKEASQTLPFSSRVCVLARDSASTAAKKHLPEDFLTGVPFRVRNNPNDVLVSPCKRNKSARSNEYHVETNVYEFLGTFVLVFVCRAF